jgi:hypothetical protein
MIRTLQRDCTPKRGRAQYVGLQISKALESIRGGYECGTAETFVRSAYQNATCERRAGRPPGVRLGGAKKRVRITDYDLCRVGTVAHNRAFTTRDLSEYLRKDAKAMVRRMIREKMLTRAGRGKYFPTKRGWRDIENACEGAWK